MYYKITDTQSKIYQLIKSKFDELKAKRAQVKEILTKAVDFPWVQCLKSSSPFNLIGDYAAFKPVDDNYTPDKHWKPFSKDFPRHFEPNRRLKKGKELAEVINRLPRMEAFDDEVFPKMKTRGEAWISNGYQINDEGIILIETHHEIETLGELPVEMIEITSVEYKALLKAA